MSFLDPQEPGPTPYFYYETIALSRPTIHELSQPTLHHIVEEPSRESAAEVHELSSLFRANLDDQSESRDADDVLPKSVVNAERGAIAEAVTMAQHAVGHVEEPADDEGSVSKKELKKFGVVLLLCHMIMSLSQPVFLLHSGPVCLRDVFSTFLASLCLYDCRGLSDRFVLNEALNGSFDLRCYRPV